MMLYTIISPDNVFPQMEQKQPEFIPHKHGFIGINKTPQGNVIQSLISTNPHDYLSSKLAPGSPYPNK